MILTRLFKGILLSFFAVSITASPICMFFDNDVARHLAEFSKYNQSHHDNIDDGPHTHEHKHSEDGEEHEHGHDHSKFNQFEMKVSAQYQEVLDVILIDETQLGLTVNDLISNAHPLKIYRPPKSV